MGEKQTPRGTDRGTARPRRPADRNRELVESDQSLEELLLPSLDAGITLLDVEGGRGVEVLQALVIDHLLLSDGPAFWVDAKGHATTTSMARLSPSRRLLDRVQVARGFTAYQHFAAITDLPASIDEHTQASIRRNSTAGADPRTDRDPQGSSHTPSLIVAPVFDAMYRTEDALGDEHAQTLLTRALARLRRYAEGYDIPVVVTRTTDDTMTAAIETIADRTLRCERTRMGPRFVGEEFETLLYPLGDGFYQTTLTYWRTVLDARAKQVGLEPSASESPVSTTGPTSTATAGANPLLDALEGPAGMGR